MPYPFIGLEASHCRVFKPAGRNFEGHYGGHVAAMLRYQAPLSPHVMDTAGLAARICIAHGVRPQVRQTC